MLDLNHGSKIHADGTKSAVSINEQINDLIDRWLMDENAKQAPRSYVSTSGIGRNCLRQIQYDYLAVPKDPGRGFDGPTLRRFQSGHEGEIIAAKWLRGAGFDLRTEDARGKQFGFATAEKDGVFRFRGHLDGCLVGCASPVAMGFPALWEHKTLGVKTWNEVVKKRNLAASKPVYAAQVALYQAYMQLNDHPAIFTAFNRDSLEIYTEMVPFDGELAQRMSDKAVDVIQASDAGELLPRCASSPDYFECRYCDFPDRCWSEKS